MINGYILIVEDDDDLRRTLCEFLTDEGYRAEGVSNGSEALDHLRKAPELPRLILLDLMMPVLDGRGFCRHQRLDPRIADIPVIVMTAGRDLARCPVPPDAILLKPLAIDRLLELIERTAARW